MKTLSVIGCGKVGSSLARLWTQGQIFQICDLLCRSDARAEAAANFVGDGQPVSNFRALREAEVFLIATPDGQIETTFLKLSDILRPGNIVFHCSGVHSAAELFSLKPRGIYLASVHPLKSFADRAVSVRTFTGTYCASEGETEALAVLTPAFQAIGAICFPILAEQKPLYHAATVMACNYLTALLESAFQAFAAAGIARETSAKAVEPLVRGTLDNVFQLGTIRALTGPIARGDSHVIEKHLQALRGSIPELAALYSVLGNTCLGLSAAQGNASEQALRDIHSLLTADEAPTDV